MTPSLIDKAPSEYLPYLEWRSRKLFIHFDTYPSRATFAEWQKWLRIYRERLNDEAAS